MMILAVEPARSIRQGSNSRRRLGAWRPLRQLIPARLGADDIRFDDDVGWSADHQQVFDIVSPHQHEATATVDGCGIDHGEPRHPSTIGVRAETVIGKPSNEPGRKHDQAQDGHECQHKSYCLHTRSSANGTL
jgi:hypothetical protein